jgi:pimeloyl-ACP methyl ester carboxylesterase
MSLQMKEFYVHDAHPMYVQRWEPTSAETNKAAAVLIHGGAHSGICWTSCPDGRSGWAQYLVSRGFVTFVVDWPGVGRSPGADDFLTCGPGPAIEALTTLLRQIGPALLIGHSMGAALSVKVMDNAPDTVSSFIAVAPAPPGIIESPNPKAPEDRAIRFGEKEVRQFFSNADRFPIEALDQYRRSLCDLSPSIFNAVAGKRETPELSIRERSRLREIPTIVIAGDQDHLVSEQRSRTIAEYLDAQHVLVGRDWGLTGFGHMMPIEVGSEEILRRALDWWTTSRAMRHAH